MSELKEFDDTNQFEEDEYETPPELYKQLCEIYSIEPKLDVSADETNSKCIRWFYKKEDGLFQQWKEDVWCNPPHSKTEEFVRKADEQWRKHNINIMMIVPANAICAHYFDGILDWTVDDDYKLGSAEYHRISGRPTFLKNGRPTKNPSRNSYFAVVWHKRG